LNVTVFLTLLTFISCTIKNRPIGGEVPSAFIGFVIVSNILNASFSCPAVINL